MDLRPGLDPLQEVFFNYVSYLFYQIPVSEVADRKALIALLKQQMYRSGEVRLSEGSGGSEPADPDRAAARAREAAASSSAKARWRRLLFRISGRAPISIPGSWVQRFRIFFICRGFPRRRASASSAIITTSRLNLVISWLDGLLSDEDVRMIESGIRKRFGAGNA